MQLYAFRKSSHLNYRRKSLYLYCHAWRYSGDAGERKTVQDDGRRCGGGQKLKNRLNSLIYIGLTFVRKYLYPHYRSLFPCLFFVARSVQKEENQLYIIVLQRFVRKPPVVTENIFLQTLGNTFENKAQKQGDLSAPLPILHIIHYTSAFYTTINLSYRHFVNPKNFNVMRQETFAILFLMQKGESKKKSIYLQSYRKIISL